MTNLPRTYHLLNERFGRRGFLAGLGAAAGLAVLASCGDDDSSAGDNRAPGAIDPDSGSITVLTWESYHNDEWLEAYKSASGVSVTAVRAGSVDEMFAKVKSNPDEFDLVYFDLGSIPRYRDAGLIVPFDEAKVANRSAIAAGLPWRDALLFEDQLWGMPYNWGTQPLMWNADEITAPPTSWRVLWDPAFKGRVTIPDDSYIGLPMIALASGVADPYNMTDADFDTCREALSSLRPQLKTFTTGFDDAKNLYASGEVVVGYCQNIAVPIGLSDDGMNFAYGYPTEGTPFWIDSAVMTAHGRRQEVFDFVSATLGEEWQVRLITDTGNAGILPFDVASAAIPADTLDRTEVANQADDEFWAAMSPLAPPNEFDRRLELWNEFKAGL